jgi:hypothetical protein
MSRMPVLPQEIGPDTPLRLDVAARIAFPGGAMTASGLRREAARGRLTIERIAGKHFTTLRHIEEMRQRCRDPQKVLDYGLNPRSAMQPANSSGARPGLSGTDRVRSARAALEETAKQLKGASQTTSQQNIKSRESGTVIPLKYSS